MSRQAWRKRQRPSHRRLATHEGKLLQRQTSAADPQPLRRAAQTNESIGQRLATGKNQRHGLKEILQLRSVIANVFLQGDIGAVERNNARFIPAL